jgi:putative FmdB family regulatory protein
LPTYEYRCLSCGAEFELSRPMSEATTPAQCPTCGGAAEKLGSAFAAKTGFYVNAPRRVFRAQREDKRST